MFIVTELLVFFAIFWAYFHRALAPRPRLGRVWPPYNLRTLDAYGLPTLNTVLLLRRGRAVTWAHHRLVAKNRANFILRIFVTLICALVFTYFQALEYQDANFTMADGVYGSAFYISTGTHGFHVIVGTLFLMVGFARAFTYRLTARHHKGLERAIVYWHMVDVV